MIPYVVICRKPKEKFTTVFGPYPTQKDAQDFVDDQASSGDGWTYEVVELRSPSEME